MVLLNSSAKISTLKLSKIEKKLSMRFPEDYKSFIIDTNGGIPEKDMLYDFYDEVTETKNTSIIRRFYSVCDENSEYNLERIFNTMYKEQIIEKDMLPIADDPLGNPLCISLKQSEYGTVYYLNHEFENVETGFLMKSKIADNFSDFIKSLYTDEN